MVAIQKSIMAEQGYSPASLESFGLISCFSSHEVEYFKCDRTSKLDEDLGDIHGAIVDMEAAIVRDLEAVILVDLNCINPAIQRCAEIDCLISMSSAALEYDWRCPQVNVLDDISIQGGRHPLQELAVPIFVENDTEAPQGTVSIVTGPNYSGKSVYIRQVALIVFLAQIGSYVPARAATIGIRDRIMTRIHSFETVSRPFSSFFTDCYQVAFILRHSTSRTLIILDEFGKGTDEVDGISLVAAVVKSFIDSEAVSAN